MGKKKKTKEDSGGKLPARDPSPNGNVENLKRLNSLLVNEIEKLRCEVTGAAADYSTLTGIELDVSRLVLSTGVADAESRCASILWRMEAERNVSLEKAEALQVKVDLAASKVREMEMRLLAEGEEKLGIRRKLDLALAEKSSTLSDLDEKRKKLGDLEKLVLQTEQEFERASAEREVAEEERRKLEDKLKKAQELLQSVEDEKIRLGICLQERRRLVENLTAEMEDLRRSKESEMVTLKAENKANAEKLSTLEERRLQLEEIRNKLQNEVCSMQDHLHELKKDNAEVVNCLVDRISSAEKLVTEMEQLSRRKESEKMHLEAENKASVAKLSTSEEKYLHLEEIRCHLPKEVDSLKAYFGELKEKMVSCREDVEKSHVKLVDELERTRVELSQARKETSAIQNASMLMVRQLTLQVNELKGNIANMAELKDSKKEIAELLSSMSVQKASHHSLRERSSVMEAELVSAQKELNHKAEEVSALRLQVDELMKANLEEKHALDNMFVANEEKQGLVDSLTANEASLEKKLKVLEMASERALSLLKETAEEVILGHERTEEKKDESRFELDDDETLQPFVEELKAIKVALKRRVTKNEEINRDMEVLRLSVEEAEGSKGRVLKWLCPAATAAFAAVSLVYAARRS